MSTTTPRDLPSPLDPTASPEEIARCEALDVRERVALLEAWRADEVALLRADGEGMAADRLPGRSPGGAASRLADVERALEHLHAGE